MCMRMCVCVWHTMFCAYRSNTHVSGLDLGDVAKVGIAQHVRPQGVCIVSACSHARLSSAGAHYSMCMGPRECG